VHSGKPDIFVGRKMEATEPDQQAQRDIEINRLNSVLIKLQDISSMLEEYATDNPELYLRIKTDIDNLIEKINEAIFVRKH
jgi:ribosome-interacting GTPase 1